MKTFDIIDRALCIACSRYKAPFTAKAWMDKFKHVVGIIHTNYVTYSHSIAFGQLKGSFLYFINQGVCRAYCHKIIKLSGALQEFAAEKEVICNVHGMNVNFSGIVSISSMFDVSVVCVAINRCSGKIPGRWRPSTY